MARGRVGGRGEYRLQDMQAGGRGGSPASALLRMRAELGLSDDQVRRLQQVESFGNRAPDQAEMLRARADLMEAMRGEGNIDAARAAMDRMNRLRTEQALSGLKARQDARNVLTAEQRSRAGDALTRPGQGIRGGFGRGGNPGMDRMMPGPRARMEMQREMMRERMARPGVVRPPVVRRERLVVPAPRRDRDIRIEPRVRRDS